MAKYRIKRRIYSETQSISSVQQNNLQKSPTFPRSSSKPAEVPAQPASKSARSQFEQLNENKKMQNQMTLGRMKLSRQDKILQNTRMKMESKEKSDLRKLISNSQKIENEKTNNQNKLQVSLNNSNRPDMGKVMPANLVKGKTIPTETKSVR